MLRQPRLDRAASTSFSVQKRCSIGLWGARTAFVPAAGFIPMLRQVLPTAGRREENAARHAEMEDSRTKFVDARGHRCPTPTLRLRRALNVVEAGETVTILADDPLARVDIPHFAHAHGHTIESVTVDEALIRVVVRKAAGL